MAISQTIYKVIQSDFGQFSNKCSTVPESVSLRTTESNTATVRTASCPHDIAELFNNYFESVLNSDDDLISTGVPSSTTEKESGLSEIELTSEDVLVTLLNLDTRKATGPDKIPPRLLKETAHQIAPSLCLPFNQSLKFGTLPEEWKLANIIPVYKKGEKIMLRTIDPFLSFVSFPSCPYYATVPITLISVWIYTRKILCHSAARGAGLHWFSIRHW